MYICMNVSMYVRVCVCVCDIDHLPKANSMRTAGTPKANE